VAFLPNGADLLAADSAGQNLVLIQNVETDAAASVVLALNQPADALAVSADGNVTAVASGATVSLLNLASGQTSSINCNCRAAQFDRLAGNLILHIADAQSGSDLLLDADAAQPRLMTLFGMNGGIAQ